jgi:hypothetical protein
MNGHIHGVYYAENRLEAMNILAEEKGMPAYPILPKGISIREVEQIAMNLDGKSGELLKYFPTVFPIILEYYDNSILLVNDREGLASVKRSITVAGALIPTFAYVEKPQ